MSMLQSVALVISVVAAGDSEATVSQEASSEAALTPEGFVEAIVQRRKIASSRYSAVVAKDDIALYDFFDRCENTDFETIEGGVAKIAMFDCNWKSRRFGFGVKMKLDGEIVQFIELVIAGEIDPAATE